MANENYERAMEYFARGLAELVQSVAANGAAIVEVSPEAFDLNGACKYLSVSKTTLYELNLRTVDIGGRKWLKKDLDKYLASARRKRPK